MGGRHKRPSSVFWWTQLIDTAHIPLFVSGRTPELLVRKMLANNIRASITYKYFDIQFDGKQWVAWYYADATALVKNEIANGLKKNTTRP